MLRSGNLHVWCPEIKTSTTVVVEGSSLSTDNLGHRLDEFVIEGGTHQDGLRERSGRVELSGSIKCDTRRRSNTVEGLLPPLVDRQTKSGYTRTVVSSKVELLGDSEGGNQSLGSCDWVYTVSMDGKQVCLRVMGRTCGFVTDSVVRERAIGTIRETALGSACECLSRGTCSEQGQCGKRK